ncbi:hypothetical protein QJS04_geneDACA014374 [Acorus gramineus]|uniref:Uncharacterized protein n=1 Tax=Acorus gramineus TaxID=55184 RepID=A0AAV9A0T7_ACOGR|nr:hypothetical protein QJS04_geneDACA014374 [Acorus gramineus]
MQGCTEICFAKTNTITNWRTTKIATPVQNPEDQRLMQELQVPQGIGHSVPPFNSITMPTPYSNPMVPPSVQSFPVQHQQKHQIPSPQQHQHFFGNSNHSPHIEGTNQSNSQHQANLMHIAKEWQQQLLLQQEQMQNQFPS